MAKFALYGLLTNFLQSTTEVVGLGRFTYLHLPPNHVLRDLVQH